MAFNFPKEATEKVTSVVTLLEGVIDTIYNQETEMLGPVDQPVKEFTVTITAKTEDGAKAIILGSYNQESGLDVYERYGSCQRYNVLAEAFQAEVDHHKATEPTQTIEDLNE